MVETTPKSNTPEVYVGLIEEPCNNLITQAMFTPSKLGGFPASISPLPQAAKQCGLCKTNLSFVGQVYSKIDELPDIHRSLFIFACLSAKCINQPNCVRVFRETAPDNNPFVKVCSDADYE